MTSLVWLNKEKIHLMRFLPIANSIQALFGFLKILDVWYTFLRLAFKIKVQMRTLLVGLFSSPMNHLNKHSNVPNLSLTFNSFFLFYRHCYQYYFQAGHFNCHLLKQRHDFRVGTVILVWYCYSTEELLLGFVNVTYYEITTRKIGVSRRVPCNLWFYRLKARTE